VHSVDALLHDDLNARKHLASLLILLQLQQSPRKQALPLIGLELLELVGHEHHLQSEIKNCEQERYHANRAFLLIYKYSYSAIKIDPEYWKARQIPIQK
jgi:hypothetical protein